MMDQTWYRASPAQGHVQGRQDELRAHVSSHGPTDYLAVVEIEHSDQIQAAFQIAVMSATQALFAFVT